MTSSFHIPYAVPTVLLALALLFKLPTFLRAWRDPEVRATTLLLFWATAALVVIIPVNIERLNEVTGVPNFAAPWAYSFLTASCATGLTMIMRWREAPSERRRRRIRRIYWIYAGIIAALWVTFIVARPPKPRIYDLDTYYATTPFMREHILLYLVAHLVSCLTAASMLWKWFQEVENRWLKTGVVFLQVGFALGLVFDLTKLTAVTARWFGTNWDWLSTKAAPPFALMEAVLAAVGFIIPQAGPALMRWGRDQSEYRKLQPLWRAVRALVPAAPARFGVWVPLDLRLMQRQQHIHDALRVLAPYFNTDLYTTVYAQTATSRNEARARAIAGAIAIRDAIAAYRDSTPTHTGKQLPQIGADITDHMATISVALHGPRSLDSIRQRVTNTENLNAHA